MKFVRICSALVVGLFFLGLDARLSQAGILFSSGDYNGDGMVTHADYSILGDTFGSESDLRADGNFNGIVDPVDFDVYASSYGQMLSLPGILPFAVVPAPLPNGSLEWTFTFSNLNGSLAGHLNIDSTSTIISMTGGPAFLDDDSGAVGVPGINSSSNVEEGISFSSNHGFAALGTTLTIPPTLPGSDSTLEFLRMVTKGPASGPVPTTLTFSGEYGYQGLDYTIDGSATFVPEPATWIIACCAMLLIATGRRK